MTNVLSSAWNRRGKSWIWYLPVKYTHFASIIAELLLLRFCWMFLEAQLLPVWFLFCFISSVMVGSVNPWLLLHTAVFKASLNTLLLSGTWPTKSCQKTRGVADEKSCPSGPSNSDQLMVGTSVFTSWGYLCTTVSCQHDYIYFSCMKQKKIYMALYDFMKLASVSADSSRTACWCTNNNTARTKLLFPPESVN